jgi:hypothetical protein
MDLAKIFFNRAICLIPVNFNYRSTKNISMGVILIALLILGVIGTVSYFVSAKAYAGLHRNKNEYARAIQILIFLVCFALLSFLTLYLILSNIRFER